MSKMKKISIPNYRFKDELGIFDFHDVEVLISNDSAVTPDDFNQEADEYSISSKEIERMGFEAARRFFNNMYAKVLLGEHALTPKEVNGIRMFLDCNGSELGDLIDLDKSSVSRILKGKQELQRHTMFLLMEKLKNEIENPGFTRVFLERLERNHEVVIPSNMQLPVTVIAEWIIRRFIPLGEHVTNLKLQKLLYYAQGVGLGRYNCKLFNSCLYAWDHGPVVKEVWGKYTQYDANPLPMDLKADLSALEGNPLALKILNETINVYGKYGAWVLREKTHSERPWLETQKNEIISEELIRDFFRAQVV